MARKNSTNHKPMQKVRDFGTRTKVVLKGDGNAAMVHRLQNRIDRFLDDAKALDESLWKVIDESKARIYSFLDAATGAGGKNENLEELRHHWKEVMHSASKLGEDLRGGIRALQRKAEKAV